MRLLRLSIFVVVLISAASSQEQLTYKIGDLKLESGAILKDCTIGYRTFGKLNSARSNALLFPAWFGGTSKGLADSIGPGKLADSSKYFVIAVDPIGNGVSTSPSNSVAQPRMKFPQFSIRDMVESQHRLLTQALGLTQVHAVMGISMGAMQTFQWTMSYPDFMKNAVPIAGSPQMASPDLLLWMGEKRAIESDPGWRGGNYTKPPALLALEYLHSVALTTPQYRMRETPREGFAEFQKSLESSDGRTDANNRLRQLEAMISHDIAKPFGGSLEQAATHLKAKLLAIVITEDQMVNPNSSIRFANAAKGRTIEIASDCGHLGTRCESARIASEVAQFLSQ